MYPQPTILHQIDTRTSRSHSYNLPCQKPIEVQSRLPKNDYYHNTPGEQICAVIEGTGILHYLYDRALEVEVRCGSILKLPKDSVFYFEGNMKMVMIGIPVWDPEKIPLFTHPA